MPKRRIALLSPGCTETSWLLMRELDKDETIELCVIATQPMNVSGLRGAALRAKSALRIGLGRCFFGRFVPARIKSFTPKNYHRIDDVNSQKAQAVLKAFRPDLLLLLGTKIVRHEVLALAPEVLNLHHGYLPSFRGVFSVGFALMERQFNHLYWTVHEAISGLDAGRVLAAEPVLPFLGESFALYQRRMLLKGAQGYLAIAKAGPDMDRARAQSEAVPVRLYRKRDVDAHFSQRSRAAFRSAERVRHTLTRPAERPALARALTPIARQLVRRSELANGFYVLNYHDICTAEEVEAFKGKAPAIYTQYERFSEHLSYLSEHFELVPLSEGIARWRDGQAQHSRFVALSFDDGLSSLEPVIADCASAGAKVTLCVSSNPLLERKPLANHRVLLSLRYALKYGQNLKETLAKYDILLKQGWHESQDAFSQFLRESYLNVETLKSYFTEGRIELASHTQSHQMLSSLNVTQQEDEIRIAHLEIERAVGQRLAYVAFPFGQLTQRNIFSDYIAAETAPNVLDCNGGINANPLAIGPLLRIGVQNEAVAQLDARLRDQWRCG